MMPTHIVDANTREALAEMVKAGDVADAILLVEMVASLSYATGWTARARFDGGYEPEPEPPTPWGERFMCWLTRGITR
jgi:hypothetical protein